MLRYKLIARANPLDRNAPPKFYPTVVRTNIIDLDYLEKEIASMCTVTPADTNAVLSVLLMLLPKHLLQGNSIHLDKFGIFSLTSQSTGDEDATKVTAHNIQKVKLNFRPNRRIRKALEDVQFMRLDV